MAAGKPQEARAVLDSLLEHQPRHAAAHMSLSRIAWADGRVRDAARHARDAALDVPPDPMSIIAVAMMLWRAGETVATRACLDHPALAVTDVAQALLVHAGLRRELGEDAKALDLLDRAHALGADGSEFRFARGLEYVICGRLKRAEADFETSLRLDPAAGAATLELARLHKQTVSHNHLEDFDGRRFRVARSSQDYAALEFARYKELEDLERYGEAWEALENANASMWALYPYDPEAACRQIDGLIHQCTSALDQPLQTAVVKPQPIFILGLPRSGTTLLDRLLGAHSQVVSVGELEDFDRQLRWSADQHAMLDARMLERLPDLDYAEMGHRYLMQTRWRAGDCRFFIDKQPWHYMVAALIQRALPQARLLHMVRDPMDVCFSGFRAMLGARYAWSFDLETLAAHHHQYRRLMAHWHTCMPGRILDVAYADLVHDTETTMRRVLAFCGLDWEPACLQPSRNSATVGTLSAVQARGPIRRDAFREWWPYARKLEGLQAALRSDQPFPEVGTLGM